MKAVAVAASLLMRHSAIPAWFATTGSKLIAVAAVLAMLTGVARADSFGTGANQFAVDFVPISGSTNPVSGIKLDTDYGGFVFRGVASDYRIGKFEITNDQLNKFKASLGTPLTGFPSNAYDQAPGFTDLNMPANGVSWYEAAQFVNWLNTSTGHQAAYKFTGTQGTSDYTLVNWSAAEADGGTNLYRHKDARYFLPTEQEWVKAAYWNGTTVQNFATKAGESLHMGDGTSGTGWNYLVPGAFHPLRPWAVGSGSEELNGTFDMMGNVLEFMESTYTRKYPEGLISSRARRGGCYSDRSDYLASSFRYDVPPYGEYDSIGFRIAARTLPGDFNNDGVISDADYTVWANFYGKLPPPNCQRGSGADGGYSDADYTAWASNYTGGTTIIPEPSSLALLALSGAAALRRRGGGNSEKR